MHNNTSKTDVSPWCYIIAISLGWDGLDGYGWMDGSLEKYKDIFDGIIIFDKLVGPAFGDFPTHKIKLSPAAKYNL